MTNEKGVIRFETNIPEEMAFLTVDGKFTEGQFGDQYYRRTTDGRQVYLIPFVEKTLLELDIQPGELVSLCKKEVKDGRKKGIQWFVTRVDPPGDPSQPMTTGSSQRAALSPDKPTMGNTRMPTKPPAQNPPAPSKPANSKPAVPSSIAQPRPNNSSPTQESNTEPPPKKPATQETAPTISGGRTHTSDLLAGAFIDTIDALIVARDYAKARDIPFNLTLAVTSEDFQKYATSIFIALSEGRLQRLNLANRNTELRQTRAANGGTAWPAH